MTTAANKEYAEQVRELSHKRDLAAYAVLGTARVLFPLVTDPYLSKAGLEAIANYDAINKALDVYSKGGK
jgi:hypothetical protein